MSQTAPPAAGSTDTTLPVEAAGEPTTTGPTVWRWVLRDAEPTDLGFILQTWIRSYRQDAAEIYQDAHAHPVPPAVLARIRAQLVAARVAGRDAVVRVSRAELAPAWDWHPVPREVYDAAQERRIKRVLARAAVRVVCDADAPEVVYGWACYEPGRPSRVHYVYVKAAWRRHGFARALLEPLGPDFVFTARTQLVEPLLGRLPRAQFNPYLLEQS